MERVDDIIWPRWIIPVVPQGRVLEQHGVAIRDGRIVALLDAAEGVTRLDAAREIHLPNHALIPGLVNAHTHAAMNLMRGVGDDLALMPWLETRIWPIERRWVGPEFVAAGSDHAVAEMIRGGITCANDMYFFPDVTLERASAAGFRMHAGCPVIEFPTAWASGPEEYLAKARSILADVANDPLVAATVSPHAPYTVGDDSLRRAHDLARAFGVRMDIHLHETAGETEQGLAEHGFRPFERLRRLGVLDERVVAVHMTHLTDAEIEQSAELGLHVVHCPESNLKLASGVCRAQDLIDAGVNLAIGTDGASSNNDLDLLGEIRTAALLAKGFSGDPTALPAPCAMEMATLGGARALGIDGEVGSIEVGKCADLVAIDLGVLEAQPVYDVISHMVYATGRHQVTDVWIDGRRVLDDRTLTTLDAECIEASTRAWRDRISEELQ